MASKSNSLWHDRKRTFCGLPWSFTKYYLTDERFIVSSGLLNTREEEMLLYRIMDITLVRSLGERIFGLGTIHLCTADKSTPEYDVKHIKNSAKVKELFSDLVEKSRKKNRIAAREFMIADNDFDADMH